MGRDLKVSTSTIGHVLGAPKPHDCASRTLRSPAAHRRDLAPGKIFIALQRVVMQDSHVHHRTVPHASSNSSSSGLLDRNVADHEPLMCDTIGRESRSLRPSAPRCRNLIFQAQQFHRTYHDPNRIQLSTLLSIKTGGCLEDPGYCPQSARYKTEVEASRLMNSEEVERAARAAKKAGATRFCGLAIAKGSRDVSIVCEMIESVKRIGLETHSIGPNIPGNSRCRTGLLQSQSGYWA